MWESIDGILPQTFAAESTIFHPKIFNYIPIGQKKPYGKKKMNKKMLMQAPIADTHTVDGADRQTSSSIFIVMVIDLALNCDSLKWMGAHQQWTAPSLQNLLCAALNRTRI